MKHFFTLLMLSFMGASFAQVGIGTELPNASTMLDISASDKGVLIPRVSLTNITDNTTISNGNITSLLIFNTVTTSELSPGFYYWDGSQWQRLANSNDIENLIDIDQTLTNLVDNGDGTITYTNEDGAMQTIDISAIVKTNETLTTLVDNGDGTLTYTNENGDTQLVDISAMATTNETLTNLIDNGDGTITYTNENEASQTIDVAAIVATNETLTNLVDNGDGTITYTNENEVSQTIDVGALAVSNQPWFGADNNAGATQNTEDIYHLGRIGIGTTTPNEQLEINGKVRINDLTGAAAPTDLYVTVDAVTGELKSTEAAPLEANGTDETVEFTLSDGTDRPEGEEVILTDDGQFIIGSDSVEDSNGGSRKIQVVNGDITYFSHLNGGGAFGLIGFKSRGTREAPLAVGAGDDIGNHFGLPYDGSSYDNGAGIAGFTVNSIWDGSQANVPVDYRIRLSNGVGGVREYFRVLGTNGNVGIGTNAPEEKLEVNGKVRISDLTGASAPTDLYVTVDAVTGELKSTEAAPLEANGTDETVEFTLSDGTDRPEGEEVVITDDGQFVIGSDTVEDSNGGSRKIQVVNGDITYFSHLNGGGAFGLIGFKSRGTREAPLAVSAGDDIGNHFGLPYDGSSYDNGAGIAGFTVNSIWDGSQTNVPVDYRIRLSNGAGAVREHFRVLGNSGNIGIGTNAPEEKLEVIGTIKATDINFTGLPIFADEAAAILGGLQTGDCYQTSTGELRIKL